MHDPKVLSSRGGGVSLWCEENESNAATEARKGVLNRVDLSN